MTAGELGKALMDHLEKMGFRAKMMTADRFFEARDAVDERRDRGEIDPVLYREYLSRFDESPSAIMPEVRSLIMVSLFQPQTRVFFTRRDREQAMILPPTYRHNRDGEVFDGIRQVLDAGGYKAVVASVPKKRLAVCSGLARYGRNNIAYVEGFGSFHRLLAFYTDLPCEDESWGEPEMMDWCADCTNCLKACPTGAIRADRFLVQADRCLTYHNEMAWPFEDWIDPAWHHCLVGCMRCQKACPENAPFLKQTDEGVRFDEGETALILEGGPWEDLPEATYRKLEHMGMIWTPNVLPRNLGRLFRP